MTVLEPIFLDTRTARGVLGLGRTKFFQACKTHELDRIKQGRKSLVTVESVRRYAEKMMLQLGDPERNIELAAEQPKGSRRPRKPAAVQAPPERSRPSTERPVAGHVGDAGNDVSHTTEEADIEDAWLVLVGAASRETDHG